MNPHRALRDFRLNYAPLAAAGYSGFDNDVVIYFVQVKLASSFLLRCRLGIDAGSGSPGPVNGDDPAGEVTVLDSFPAVVGDHLS